MVEPDPEDESPLLRRWRELESRPSLRRLDPRTLRAAWWAWNAVRNARRDLAHDGVTAAVADPPQVPWGSRTGVYGVLNRTAPTCLERCVVSQKWLSAHGLDTTVVIGVRRTDDGDVRAHAWIDEASHPDEFDGFRVIHRIGPPG